MTDWEYWEEVRYSEMAAIDQYDGWDKGDIDYHDDEPPTQEDLDYFGWCCFIENWVNLAHTLDPSPLPF